MPNAFSEPPMPGLRASPSQSMAETHPQSAAGRAWFLGDALATCERIANSPIRLTTNSQVNRCLYRKWPLWDRCWVISAVRLNPNYGADGSRGGPSSNVASTLRCTGFFPLLAWVKNERLTPRGLFSRNNVGYFGEYESILRYGGGQGAHWSGCGAGHSCIGVESDGKIKGCPSLPSDQFTGGYTHQDSLVDVVSNAPEVNHIHCERWTTSGDFAGRATTQMCAAPGVHGQRTAHWGKRATIHIVSIARHL